MSFSAVWPKGLNVPNEKIEYAYFQRLEKYLSIVQNGSFLLFLHFKMVAYKACYEGSFKKSYS